VADERRGANVAHRADHPRAPRSSGR
jgi:hypothetical protein